MNRAQRFDHHLALPPIPNVTPIVFVMAGDISVRESLESLIRCEGWQFKTFESAQEFLGRTRPLGSELHDSRSFPPGPEWSRNAEENRARAR